MLKYSIYFLTATYYAAVSCLPAYLGLSQTSTLLKLLTANARVLKTILYAYNLFTSSA